MHRHALLVAVTLLALLAAGCSSDPTTVAPPSTPGDRSPLIAPERLAAFVPPAPEGWRLAAPPSAATLEENGTPIVSVTASYVADGDRSADLVIQDTAGRPVGLRRLADGLMAAPGGSATVASLRGQPAVVVEDGGLAGEYVVVAGRYVVWCAVAGGTRADLDAFSKGMDIEGLAEQR